MEPNQVDIVAEYADILQVGTRNMQNFSLLMAVGRVARPVMLKRGFSATVEEWLMAAEYIVSSGNPNVILCERGIRTFETYTRNTLDLAAVPLLRQLTHLPVIVDPSHATGKRWLVAPLAIGGVAVGADGVMVEVHPDPDRALSDAEQQLTFDQFRSMMAQLVPVHDQVRGLRERADRRASRRGRRPAPGSGGTDDDDDAVDDRTRDGRGRAARLRGELRLPGDKSISHRALMLATLAAGESRITGAGDGADVRSTAAICRALGRDGRADRRGGRSRATDTSTTGSSRRASTGSVEPAADLDCGNSGTSLRLFAGILAGLPFRSVLDGDDSLRGRPVARIIEPLRAMGATVHARATIPSHRSPSSVVIRSIAVDRWTPVPSAQVKSAILLAGLRADGSTTVRERVATRDHTERMLRARGIDVRTERLAGDAPAGQTGAVAITVNGGQDDAGDRRARSRRRVGGRLLARRRRHPPRRRPDAPRRRRRTRRGAR